MDDAPPAPQVLQPVRRTFRAVAVTVVPRAAELDEDGWGELEAIVDRALSSRPPAVRRQLLLFLHLIRWLPLLRWARPFTALGPERRGRFLAALERAPLLPLRQGFWGIRSLVFMGYYGREDAARAIGYDARLRGRRERGPVRGDGAGEVLEATPGPPSGGGETAP